MALEQIELHLAKGGAAAQTLFEILIILSHQFARSVVADQPSIGSSSGRHRDVLHCL
jgi:hypothetical protein